MLASARAVLVLALAVAPGAALARCGDDPADAAAIADARAAVEAKCGCATTRSHAAYVACAKSEVRARIRSGVLPRRCGKAVRRCAARSTCGKRGVATCCLQRKGRTVCKVLRNAARCTAKHGCVGVFASCCDACTASGCRVPTTTSTTTTTTTTSSTTTSTTATTSTTSTTGTTTTTIPVDGQTCVQTASGDTGPSQHEPFPCGTAVACRIDTGGDTDAFTLDVPAGGALSIDISGPGTSCWELFDPNGMSVPPHEQCDQINYVSGLQAGTHTILVRSFNSQPNDYVLSVDGISQALQCGATLSLPNDQASGDLQPGGDTDSFQFVASQDDVVSIDIAGSLHPCWRLFDPSGNSVINQDFCAPAGSSQAGPLGAGTHTILVHQATDQPTSYTLSLQRVTP